MVVVRKVCDLKKEVEEEVALSDEDGSLGEGKLVVETLNIFQLTES